MPEVFAPGVEPILDGYTDARAAAVNRAQFEGGYSQRSRTGPNNVGRVLSLSFVAIDAVADAIDAFLTARGGSEAFEWQSPWDSSASLWTCADWSKVPIGRRGAATVWRLSATFNREFDPV